MWDGQLGDFLRQRRDALAPEEVGLKSGPRRRAQGLRRAEVAVRAGISVEYLTRLEQGHDTNPSIAVLASLADALALDADDRAHLHALAGVARGTDLLCGPASNEASVPEGVVRLLGRVEPAPACVMDHRGHLPVWNRAFPPFAAPLGILEATPPNLLRWVFEHDQATAAVNDWDGLADEAAAWLYQFGHGDPAVEQIASELTVAAGSTFSRRWEAHLIGMPPSAPRLWQHPAAGPLTLHTEVLGVTSAESLHVILFQPADDATETALASLTKGQGR